MTGRHARAIPPAPVPPPDPFAALNVLEAAGYLEAMRQAVELVGETYTTDQPANWPGPAELAGELEELRAEARAIFERKFFEVN